MYNAQSLQLPDATFLVGVGHQLRQAVPELCWTRTLPPTRSSQLLIVIQHFYYLCNKVNI